ncbi:hypothetical protein AB0N93_30355 [Streptomyces sp. NPDC091267]|uniref:hypothetical protein n=1 Tax=unclassified Streptomyces TaxID=2593676 RepID=UPI00341DCED9
MNPTTPTTPTAPVAEGDGEKTTAKKAVTDTAGTKDSAEHRDEAATESGAAADRAADADLDLDGGQDFDAEFEEPGKESSGLGVAAAAVVSAGLGVVTLSGGWTSRVAAERETLLGQMKTASGGSAAQQISEIYGDAWHATALVNGLFGLVALLVGVFVLVRPAFGRPSAHPQAGWVRAVATAGIVLGVLGVLIAVCMYFDLIVALPTAPAAPAAGS